MSISLLLLFSPLDGEPKNIFFLLHFRGEKKRKEKTEKN
jgi:hypothetical protein